MNIQCICRQTNLFYLKMWQQFSRANKVTENLKLRLQTQGKKTQRNKQEKSTQNGLLTEVKEQKIQREHQAE